MSSLKRFESQHADDIQNHSSSNFTNLIINQHLKTFKESADQLTYLPILNLVARSITTVELPRDHESDLLQVS